MDSLAPTRRPRADAERNRRRVVDAATRVFAEHGSNATLNDVAREAGVGVGTVYRKFADKEAMLDALFDEKVDTMVALAERAATTSDAGEAVRLLLFSLMEKRASDRGLDAILGSPDRGMRFSDELSRRFLPTVELLVSRAIAAAEVRPGFSADEVCLLAFMVGKVADITRASDPEVWRRYAQLLVDGTRPTPEAAPLTPAALSFADSALALGRAN